MVTAASTSHGSFVLMPPAQRADRVFGLGGSCRARWFFGVGGFRLGDQVVVPVAASDSAMRRSALRRSGEIHSIGIALSIRPRTRAFAEAIRSVAGRPGSP